MRLSGAALENYVADVAELLERYGGIVDPDAEPGVNASPSGARWFDVRGTLPDGRTAPRSVVTLREVWRPAAADAYERTDYGYELLDHDRGCRRALHLHDREHFVRRFQIVVHEHCEKPIGTTRCDHFAGLPIRDAFAGVELLVRAWIDPIEPDCDALICLEAG